MLLFLYIGLFLSGTVFSQDKQKETGNLKDKEKFNQTEYGDLINLSYGKTIEGKDNKLVYDLSGFKWLMEGTLPGEGEKKRFHEMKPVAGIVKVPGDVYTDLWRWGQIEDPHVSTNRTKAKWAMDYEWWYFREFDVPKEMEGKKIKLMFDGVDYACDVWLNGHYLGNHEGSFSPFNFDISKLVKLTTPRERSDNNFLAIKLRPAPRTWELVAGRKYRWHGDYGYNVTPMGIWRPVWLEATGPVNIQDVYVKQDFSKSGAAHLCVEVELFNDSYKKRNLEIAVTAKGKNFESKSYTTVAEVATTSGVSRFDIPLEIKNPKLWYPWDLGEQNLYTVVVSVREGADFQDLETTTIGIRKLEMMMNPGWTKEEIDRPWTVMINGKRHYQRSAAWGGPPDIFTGRVTKEQYVEYIRLAKEANINNLRIFNRHPVETQLFYDLCNEAGITVWQDLPITDMSTIRPEEFKQAIIDESISMVKQVRNHPCVTILSGGEEVLYTQSDFRSDWALQFIFELERILQPLSQLHWVPTVPMNFPNVQKVFKEKSTVHAHAPHYGAGSVMLEDYFLNLDYAYVPELAISSSPSVESIKKFLKEDELWPPGKAWGHHWADLDFMRVHNYEIFGNQYTHSLEDFVKASQIAQGVFFQFASEHFRRQKPKNSGISLCHFMLQTPDFKWAIVDFYLQKKRSFDYVKRAFQPVLVSLYHDKRRWLPGETFKGKIWVVNDLYQNFTDCKVKVVFRDNNKAIIKEQTLSIGKIGEDSSKEFGDISCTVPGVKGDKFYVEMKLQDKSGKIISENEYFLLVGDQEEAKTLMKKMHEEVKARTNTKAKTLRYFPELMGDEYVPTKYLEEFK